MQWLNDYSIFYHQQWINLFFLNLEIQAQQFLKLNKTVSFSVYYSLQCKCDSSSPFTSFFNKYIEFRFWN